MRLVTTVIGLGLLLGGCSTAQDVLDGGFEGGLDGAVADARARADDLLAQGRELAQTFEWCAGAAQLSQAVASGDVEGARAAADKLRTTAPEDLSEDLRTVAEAAARAQVGDPRVFLDDEVQAAASDVYAYAVELCGLARDDA